MKKYISLLLILGILLPTIPLRAQDLTVREQLQRFFYDGHEFANDDIAEHVLKMRQEYDPPIRGYDDGTFRPRKNISHFEGLKIITKTLGEEYFKKFLIWNRQNDPTPYNHEGECIDGFENPNCLYDSYAFYYYNDKYQLTRNTESYNQAMTRGFAIYYALRNIGITLSDSDYNKINGEKFSDVNNNTLFGSYIQFAKYTNIVRGAQNRFQPNSPISRGEFAKIIGQIRDNKETILNTYRDFFKENKDTERDNNGKFEHITLGEISPELRMKLNTSVSKRDSQGNITQYDNIKFDSPEQFAEFFFKVRVKADPLSLGYGKQVSQYRQNGKIKGGPYAGRYYSDTIKGSILYSWLTGQDANGKQVGQGYTGEIPAFAAVNISTQGNSNAQGGDLGKYRTYGSISTPTAYTSTELNSLLKGWGKLNIVPSVVAPGFEFGMRENDMRSLEAEFNKSSSAKSKYSSAQQMISSYNGSAITQDVYNQLVKLGMNTSEWQIQGTTIVYLPSRLSFDTGFVGGNVGDYAIKIDLSLSAISFATSTGQLGESTFRVGGPEMATWHDAYGFTSPLYLVSGIRN